MCTNLQSDSKCDIILTKWTAASPVISCVTYEKEFPLLRNETAQSELWCDVVTKEYETSVLKVLISDTFVHFHPKKTFQQLIKLIHISATIPCQKRSLPTLHHRKRTPHDYPCSLGMHVWMKTWLTTPHVVYTYSQTFYQMQTLAAQQLMSRATKSAALSVLCCYLHSSYRASICWSSSNGHMIQAWWIRKG